MKDRKGREIVLAAFRSGLVGLNALLDWLGKISKEEIDLVDLNRICEDFKLKPDQIGMLEQEIDYVSDTLAHLEGSGKGVLMIWDERYPQLLREINMPPFALFYCGDLTSIDGDSIAIVGSRRPSLGGIKLARKLAHELADTGFTIVSGLARGIDTAAHQGALDAGAKTIAVLGSGVDVIYPVENASLADRICRNGLIISEQWMGTPPLKHNFPMRNRIISGLCLGTVVVEAGQTSGALITANFALEQNRDVFAVPCSPLLPQSKGVNKLLKEGAILVESADDIIREVKPQIANKRIDVLNSPEAHLDQVQTTVLDLISEVPVHIDEITRASQLEMQKVLEVMFSLESRGLVKSLPGKFYIRA